MVAQVNEQSGPELLVVLGLHVGIRHVLDVFFLLEEFFHRHGRFRKFLLLGLQGIDFLFRLARREISQQGVSGKTSYKNSGGGNHQRAAFVGGARGFHT